MQPLDLALADAVEQCVPAETPIMNLYSAAGPLAASLALQGRCVRSLEGALTRYEAQRELRDVLAPQIAEAGGSWSVECAMYLGDRDFSGQCVVAANAVITMTEPDYEAVLASLATARFVIIDLLRFVRRIGPNDVPAALALFERNGLRDARLVADLGDSGQVYVFQPTSAAADPVPEGRDGKPAVRPVTAQDSGRDDRNDPLSDHSLPAHWDNDVI